MPLFLNFSYYVIIQEIVTGHVDEVWALATHPQQNQFLSASYDQFIHLWDTLTHRTIWSSNIGVCRKNLFDTKTTTLHPGGIRSHDPRDATTGPRRRGKNNISRCHLADLVPTFV
jgi:WD40 repeat protein